MSAIVPWTDPGGTPCCCEEECFTDFANEPRPVYAENSFTEITAADYSALYAGGTYTASVELDIEGFRDALVSVVSGTIFRQTERHFFSGSGIALTQESTPDGPCYERYSAPITINREFEDSFGSGSNTYPATLRFFRSLGTENGGRRLSLASVNGPSSPTSVSDHLLLDNFQSYFPATIRLRSGNMTGTVPYTGAGAATYFPDLPKVNSSVSLSLVGGGTYAAYGTVTHPFFNSFSHYEQVINGAPAISFGYELYGDVEGSVDVQVTFSPSAP